MQRESKIFLFSYFLISIGTPGQFIFAIKKADPITGTLMVAIYHICIVIASIAFSKLSDRYMKRKILILFGFIVFAGIYILYYFVTTPFELILCSGLIGIGFAAYNPISNALFSEMEPTIPSGKLMSYFFISMSGGWAVGSILLGVVNQFYGDLVFIFASLITIIGLFVHLLKVRDVPYDKVKEEEFGNTYNNKSNPNLTIYSTLIILLSISVLIRHLCVQGGFALFTNYLEEGLFAEPLVISLILSVNMTMQAIILLPLGRLVDHKKFGRKIVLLLGILGSQVSVFLWSLIQIPWILIFPQMLIGFAWPAIATSSTALINDITTRRTRSQGMGWFTAGLSVGGSIGPLLAGLIFAQSGGDFALAFQLMSIFPIVAIILLLVSFSEDRTTHQYQLRKWRKKN